MLIKFDKCIEQNIAKCKVKSLMQGHVSVHSSKDQDKRKLTIFYFFKFLLQNFFDLAKHIVKVDIPE